jgi:hypothetical protein
MRTQLDDLNNALKSINNKLRLFEQSGIKEDHPKVKDLINERHKIKSIIFNIR